MPKARKPAPIPEPAPVKDTTVKARLNHGRWVVVCPDCPDEEGHALEVTPGLDKMFVCPVCYPDMRAIAFQVGSDGLLRPVPDMPKRQSAANQADADGRAYRIIYPDNPDAIMETVRQRPTPNMNWEPGETLEFLQAENNEHGVGPTPATPVVVEGK